MASKADLRDAPLSCALVHAAMWIACAVLVINTILTILVLNAPAQRTVMLQVVIMRLDVILAAAPATTFNTDYMSKLNAIDVQYTQRTEQWKRVSDACAHAH